MTKILIYLTIVLFLVFIAYVVAFINYEISKEKEETKQKITNLQTELDKLKECCNNNRLDSIYTNEDKNLSNDKQELLIYLLMKIINDLYNLSDNHLVEYNDIEKIINIAKLAESIIKELN